MLLYMRGVWELNENRIQNLLEQSANRHLKDTPYSLEEIIIFGSYGRGVATDGSDLDVLLVVDSSEQVPDVKRRDIFTFACEDIQIEIEGDLPSPIHSSDVLMSTFMNRDKMLLDFTEALPKEKSIQSPCMAYNLTEREQITVIHP